MKGTITWNLWFTITPCHIRISFPLPLFFIECRIDLEYFSWNNRQSWIWYSDGPQATLGLIGYTVWQAQVQHVWERRRNLGSTTKCHWKQLCLFTNHINDKQALKAQRIVSVRMYFEKNYGNAKWKKSERWCLLISCGSLPTRHALTKTSNLSHTHSCLFKNKMYFKKAECYMS